MTICKKHSILIICSLWWTALGLYAQDSIPEYGFIINTNPWLNSANAAGLNEFSERKLSIATLRGNKSDGEFINYYESKNSFDLDIFTETYYRISNKTMVYGKVNYSYSKGQNMGGSSFINPNYNAFNIVEYADSTAGDKVKESYSIVGGISTQLSKQLSLGAKINYQNISFYKTRDLRHTNDMLDLKLNTGLSYQFNNLDLGLSYYYHRSVESIIFNTFGNTDQQYNSLIDYGGFFGTGEPYDNVAKGMSSGGSENPYFNVENGLNLQFNLFSNKPLSFFNEIALSLGDGHYGRRSTSTVVYTDHSSNTYSYSGTLTLDRNTSIHQLSLKGSFYDVANTLNDYTEIRDSIKGNVIVYGISQQVSSKDKLSLSVAYSGYYGIKDNKPLWHLKAKAGYQSNKLRSIYYKYLTYRDQEINKISGDILAYRNFYKERNSYRIRAGLGYSTGSGFAFKDTYFTETQGQLVTLDRYAYREYDYLTAERVNAQIAFRFARLINRNKAEISGQVNYSATKAFDTSYIGDYFGCLSLSLGYQF